MGCRGAMRTSICCAMLAAAVCLALAAPGLAARPASPDELTQMAAAAEFEADCIASATVSTVNGGWGRLDPQANLPGCPEGNGFFVMQFAPGEGWDIVWQGSDVFACPAADVPDDVGADLNVCRKGKTLLLCLPKSEDLRTGRSKPSSCTTLGPRDAFCCAANLVKLSWKHWGDSQATGTGYERGFHLPLSHIKAKVTAYGRKVADCGDYVYTRLKVHTHYGTLRQKFPAQCSDEEGSTEER